MRSGVASSRTNTRDGRLGLGAHDIGAATSTRSALSTSRVADLPRQRDRDDPRPRSRTRPARSASRRSRSYTCSTSARSGYAPLMKNSCVKRSGNECSRNTSRLLARRGRRGPPPGSTPRAYPGIAWCTTRRTFGLVDAHAERVGRDDRAHALVHERVLHLVAVRVVEPRVVRDDGHASHARSTARHALDGLARGRVDDRLPLVLRAGRRRAPRPSRASPFAGTTW